MLCYLWFIFLLMFLFFFFYVFFFVQAEDGIRDLVRSRGLGDVYKRQDLDDLSDLYHPCLSFCIVWYYELYLRIDTPFGY